MRGECADTGFEVPTGEAFEKAYDSLFPSAGLSARIDGLVSLGANGRVRDASDLANDYSSSSFRWQARANFEVAVIDQRSAEGRFAYFPAVDLPQGRSDARLSADLGLRYRFLDRKAFLNVSVQDPLGLQGSAVETRDRAHVQIRRSSQSSRSVHVNMSYVFVPGPC